MVGGRHLLLAFCPNKVDRRILEDFLLLIVAQVMSLRALQYLWWNINDESLEKTWGSLR